MTAKAVTRTLYEPPGGGAVRRTTLPGGLRVVTERIPGALSATLGVWVDVGSRDETPSLAGTSHYLEHLLFKGTRRRTALQIASEMDAVGGEMNAFTAKEHTCFYAQVVAADLPLAVDLVTDVVLEAVVAAADVESERSVVLEEIAMRDDDPADAVHDLMGETLYGDHPLGRAVIGSVGSIEALTRTQVAGYYRRRYQPSRMVVAAAGDLDHRTVVDRVRRAFADRLDPAVAPGEPRRGTAVVTAPSRRVGVIRRRGEQAHLMLGSVGLDRFDERRFTLGVLNAALGGGMSSRLFQEIREKRGLAYTTYSYATSYADTGQFGLYAGCSPRKAKQVLSLMREVCADVARHGLTPEEVERGIGQLRGSMVLGLEDTAARMSRIGKSELSYADHLSVEEVVRRIEAVTPVDVADLAADLLGREQCLAVVGPFDERSFTTALS